MTLPRERAGPYLRALQAGLHALSPSDVHVPLAEALRHLEVLDPALSGDLFLPAELDPHSGMPAFTWLERARGEQILACEGGAGSTYGEDELARARRLDAALGERLAARATAHRFLRTGSLLPATRLRAALRRIGRTTDVVLTYDRLAGDGRWVRLVVDLSGPPRWLDRSPFRRLDDPHLAAEPGVQHLLTRHSATPLLSLQGALAEAFGVRVSRLSRGTIGPFWFPGGDRPADAPPWAARALVLHLLHEVVGDDVRRDVHLDPLSRPPQGERPPEGQHVFRERRLAVSPPADHSALEWSRAQGQAIVVAPLRPRPDPSAPLRRSL
ncbi:MAG: hypothetical protein H6742_05680 [Alphaproteobacteria bacterium]|nr:hypothetical protein [Alphaproteobacteria bacterium]